MVHRAAWECVDALCKKLKHSPSFFGSIPFIALGDFCQVAPVIPGGGPTTILRASVRNSPLWSALTITHLMAPIHTQNDPAYMTFIDHLGEDYTTTQVSLELINHTTNINTCADFLFPQHVLEDPNLASC